MMLKQNKCNYLERKGLQRVDVMISRTPGWKIIRITYLIQDFLLPWLQTLFRKPKIPMAPCYDYYSPSRGCNSCQLIHKLHKDKIQENIPLSYSIKLTKQKEVYTYGTTIHSQKVFSFYHVCGPIELEEYMKQTKTKPWFYQGCVPHSPWTKQDQIAHQGMVDPKHLLLEKKPANSSDT